MNPTNLIKQIVLAALLCLAALVCMWLAGANYNEQKWLAKQATLERAAHSKYEAEVVRSDKAVGAFVADYQAMQSDFKTLTEKFNVLKKRTRLVIADPAAAGRNGLHGCISEAPSGQADDGDRVEPVLHLSAGAVWMWNSALTGIDQPANTCGAGDPTALACAVATRITLDEAWASHTINAQICAENRLAHQRLIDFLNQREPRPERVKP